MTRVGYAKLGRAMPLSPAKWGQVGGDNEPPILLQRLARAYPDVEWVIIGRNDGADPSTLGFPPNVINGWTPDLRARLKKVTSGNNTPMTLEQIDQTGAGIRALMDKVCEGLDGIVVWAGQHGTSNSRIPKVGHEEGDIYTKPQDAFVYYAGYILDAINKWRDKDPINNREVWLCPDVRNYLKGRDLKWPPHVVLAQYNFTKKEKHFRFGDDRSPEQCGFDAIAEWCEPGVWKAAHPYEYAQLELCGIPSAAGRNGEVLPWEQRVRFGAIVNENRAYVAKDRMGIVQQWVLPLQPDFLHGKWSEASQRKLDTQIKPIPWPQMWAKLGTARCTLSTPASGSGWATTKPWEAFAVGTVCFFHPFYDDQGNVIPRRDQTTNDPLLNELRDWLRVQTPEELKVRVDLMTSDVNAWVHVARLQRRLFDREMDKMEIVQRIGQEVGLGVRC